MKYYAVKVGRKIGIYSSWDECNQQVKGYSGAQFKKFESLDKAKEYIGGEMESEYEKRNISKDEIIAYVDGSYNKETRDFGFGLVLIDHEGLEETSNGFMNHEQYSEHRNVAGEIFASMKAIERAIELKKKKIYIHYDYMGIKSWAVKEWKANKELTKNYQNFISEKNKIIDIEFIKVLAHSNNKYNDIADRLAKDACGIKWNIKDEDF